MSFVSTAEELENQPQTISAEDQKRLVRWRVSTFWVMLVGYIGYYLCRGNLPAAFPLLEKQFGFSNSQLGMIAAYSEIAYAIGKFINGPLADRLGGKRIFILGMAGAIFFNIAFAYSNTLAAFIVIWCLCRYFLSMGWGGIVKTIGNWYPPERNGTIMGLISVNFQFGGVAASLFAGAIIAVGFGWQAIFIIPAITLFFIMVWAFFASKEHPRDLVPGTTIGRSDKGKKQIADFGDESNLKVFGIIATLLKLPVFRQLLFFSFLTTLLRSVFFFWTPKFLFDLGLGATNAVLKSALFPFLGCLGTVLLGWWTDHHAKDGDRAKMMTIMLIGLFLCMIGIALLSASGLTYEYSILALLAMSGFFLLGPYSMSSGCLTLDIAGPKGAGSCTGMIDGIGYIGGALAAWGAGYVSDYIGWPEVFMVLAGFAFLSAVSSQLMSAHFRKLSKHT